MATEFKPGVPTAVFTKLMGEIRNRGRIALVPVADGIVRQAKINASNGQHQPHTPTPSSGAPTGPAMISGNLVKTIDRTTPVRISVGWLCQVGIAQGIQQSLYDNGNRASSDYGKTLELTGVHGGRKFPFLYPAARFGFDVIAPVVYTNMYGSGWARLA